MTGPHGPIIAGQNLGPRTALLVPTDAAATEAAALADMRDNRGSLPT